jgi:hypothetical protein
LAFAIQYVVPLRTTELPGLLKTVAHTVRAAITTDVVAFGTIGEIHLLRRGAADE